MLYIRETTKSVDRAFEDLEASVKKHGFGMLHYYDFRKTLAEKGFTLANECRVLEVCNPKQASEVLSADMSLNMVLPCRISIYQDKGKTLIGMVPPSALLPLVSNESTIAATSAEVERTMEQIINDAV
jgi:uncharacterized protein (DUF302 family)